MREPEQIARAAIDDLLRAAGWQVCGVTDANIHGASGVAIREFPLPGYGFADYLLYVDGKAAGVIEAKKQGVTLSGVETQSAKYTAGLPESLPAWSRPLPFSYQSTGVETRFTSGLDPEPRSRPVFAFHRPETLRELLKLLPQSRAMPTGSGARGLPLHEPPPTFLTRLRAMPLLFEQGLWPAQITAIKNLEKSLAANKPRALIQMATGSGKTYTAINFLYRLIKFAGARRVLFLVDRGNLGRQTKKEFDQYVSPYNNFKFGEEYIVQHLTSNNLDKTARVCIATIQRLYSMLKGRELSEDDEERSPAGLDSLFKAPEPLNYNPEIPIETFDVIVTDEAHRSIYNLWRQVLEYFDAYLIGLTATPSKQTFGFFNQNLVMEYGHEQAVADGVNVNYDVYRIRTQVSEAGGKVESGYYVDLRDKLTRKVRWEQLDEEFAYDPNQLDRNVVALDQIRTLVRTFRDKLFTEIFPGRTQVPKTLIFAKDDSHAEDIVRIVREEFAKGNEFAQKITYRTTGETPERLIAAFRNSYHPRIAVTVDMIATGTDIKPLEIVMFMRAVKSRTFFEQMKGRGVRVISPDDLKGVTPDAKAKDHFVIVDCVGVCERDMTDSRPMDQKKSVPLDKLLQAVALGNTEPDVLSSVAARLARLEKHLPEADQAKIAQASGGYTLKDLARRLVDALNPDRIVEAASRRLETLEDASCRFLNPYAPIDIHRANLPHWRQDDVTYFVTFRLADSLPTEKLRQWRGDRDRWLRDNPKPWTPEQDREYFERFSRNIEFWLDQGAGSCLLWIREVNELVEQALRYFDGARYRLGEFVIAANHVHMLVTPLKGHDLSAIVHSWKSYTAKQILKVEAASRRLQSSDTPHAAAAGCSVWQKEYYDRIVRNPEELYNIEQYIKRHTAYVEAASCRLSEEDSKRRDAASTELQSQVARELAQAAVKPLCDPRLRELILALKQQNEQIIDTVTQDAVLEAGFSEAARERAKQLVTSFEQFIQQHKDEITALQILYNRPTKAPLKFEDLKALADTLQAPPHLWTESQLWQAYAALDQAKVKGKSTKRILTDLVSLVRYAMHQENELVPYPERVMANFKAWMAQQEASSPRPRTRDNPGGSGRFTDEQRWWLEKMAEHIASNLGIEAEDFGYAPFDQRGGLGRVHQLFGAELPTVLSSLNDTLAA